MKQIIAAVLGNPDHATKLKALNELLALQVAEAKRQAMREVIEAYHV